MVSANDRLSTVNTPMSPFDENEEIVHVIRFYKSNYLFDAIYLTTWDAYSIYI